MYPEPEMSLTEALDILQKICPSELSKKALVRVQNCLTEKTRRINELKTINDFLEEYVTRTVQPDDTR
jgi:hypothetical protein